MITMIEAMWGELILPDGTNASPGSPPLQNPFPVRGKKFVIGRHKECDLQLSKKQVSNNHCYLTKDDDNAVWLYDTSLNGTIINKKIKVSGGKCREVHDGDMLYLVHKKKDPSMDFFLIFKMKQTVEDSIPPSCSKPTASTAVSRDPTENRPDKVDFKPLKKRMKFEDSPSSVDETLAEIKEEPIDFDNSQTELISMTIFDIKEEPRFHANSDDASTVELPMERLDARLRADFPEDCRELDSDRATSSPNKTNKNIKAKRELDSVVSPERDDNALNTTKDHLNKDIRGEQEVDNVSSLGMENNEGSRESSQNTEVDKDASTQDVSAAKASLKRHKSAVDDSVAEVLQCSLCLDILHDPICLQPCMHCYCSACYSQWMNVSDDCPQCRSSVERLSRNHLVGSLVEAYLKDNPDKRRSPSDIERLDGLNTITADMLNANRHYQSSDSEDEAIPFYIPLSMPIPGTVSFQIPHVPRGSVHTNCRQCPQVSSRPKPKGKRKTNESDGQATPASQDVNVGASSSTGNNPATDYSCPPGQPHAMCNCCYKSMPDRRNEAGVPSQQCSICKLLFCHLYWGCQKPGCSGCLNKFEDTNYTEGSLQDVVGKNKVETQILFDALKSQKKNSKDLARECMSRLDDGTYKCTLDISSSTVLCFSCALRNFRTLAYFYRRDLPQNILPGAVTGRPDCHWGRNCRTQGHNISHAERYNHICEQTRF